MNLPDFTFDLGFTVLEIFDSLVISRIREEVIFDVPQMELLISTLVTHYKERPFIYLSERVNHYNVNPIVYFKLKEVKNLCGIGIVCRKPSSAYTAIYEKHFVKIPFEIFPSLEDATLWSKKLMEKRKQTCKPDFVL